MYQILKLVLLAANCAPATFVPIAAPLAQPYFFVVPKPQTQFKYQPLLKIQQPEAPAAVGRIDAPKDQYVLVYPSMPQLPLLALRQNETPDWATAWNSFWGGITSGFQNPSTPTLPSLPEGGGSLPSLPEGGGSLPSLPEGGGSLPSLPTGEEPSKDLRMEGIVMENMNEAMSSLVPASTIPLNMNKQRFYLIGQPQFYGNFAALQPASISDPILAYQPLQARSTVDSIPAEEQIEKLRSKDLVEVSQQPTLIQPIQQLQLRSSIVDPVQRLDINQPQVPVVNNEPVPEVAAQQLARFLEEARSQDGNANSGNTLNENDLKNDNKLRAEDKPLEEEASIAQAKPSGIALSGKGGVSSSAPSATAVVGEGGLALASPSAIALSGDFEEEDEERKIAPME